MYGDVFCIRRHCQHLDYRHGGCKGLEKCKAHCHRPHCGWNIAYCIRNCGPRRGIFLDRRRMFWNMVRRLGTYRVNAILYAAIRRGFAVCAE